MKTVKLGDVCKIIGGGTPSKNCPEYWDGDVLWMSVRDMNTEIIDKTERTITELGLKNSSSNLIPARNIIIASRVGLGKICWIKNDTAINQDLRAIIPKDEDQIDKQWLILWLRSNAQKIVDAGTGATVQGVKLTFLNSLEMELPPLAEQREIVRKLDDALGKIDRAEKLLKENIENVSLLQKSILAEAFDNTSADTHTHRLGDLCKIKHGKDWKGLKSGNIPVYGSGGFMGKYVDTYAYDKPTVLLPRKGTITNIFYLDEPFWNVDTVFYTDINTAKLEPKYLYYHMRAIDLETLDSGSGRPSLTQSALYEIDIITPSLADQQKIVNKLDKLFAETKKLNALNATKLQSLAALRKSILAEAFSA
ncbi:type I restriction modification system subunit S [Alphaproteobacteria bacterium]|nr:type I restriction modification system subunit S [Alphaproteobacteria bacterium]